MRLRDKRWYVAYGLVIGLILFGMVRLMEGWLWDTKGLTGLLLTQGLAVLLGFALHESLHLMTALRHGVSAGSVKAGWFRFWVLEPVEVRVYRRVMLAPLVLPVMMGLLAGVWVDWRLALAVALLWLLGSADDLADWVRLWGVKGAVTNRPGEGLRLIQSTTNSPSSMSRTVLPGER